MGKTVVIAEKPSVGRSIAKVLGCNQYEEGYCHNNSNYIVTWAVGHLVGLQNPDEIDEKYKKWDMSLLPILPTEIPLKVIPSTSKQFNIVKKLMNASDTDSLVCATDAGREGELIFRYIYVQANCKKPFKRLWISSLTDEAIREGFRSLAPGTNYDALYRSAKCRSEADWLVGMNASRAFSIRYDALLSVGRVQTPTLAFLVKRRKEIEEFVPKDFYTVTADFGDYKGVMFSDKLDPDTHIAVKEQATRLAEMIKGRTGVVTKAETQRKHDQSPQLFDLTSLQREANKHFGFTAEKTLQLAQSLYETHKALTYPRTDSRYLPNDMIPVIPRTVNALPEEYAELGKGCLHDGKVTVSKRVFDESKVSDHHAILPTTKTADMSAMNDAERKLFDLVVRRMLAAFYPSCEYDSTKVITQVDRFNFRTNGKTIIDPGWRVVYLEEAKPMGGDDDSSEESTLPSLKEGDRRTVTDAIVKEDTTKPPSPYTDASLLLAMETAGKDSDDEEIVQQMKGHGIGTPATRASIIERIIEVKCAERKGKAILATDKGVALIQIMPVEISSAETTGKWEMALDRIAENKQDPSAFRESICRFSTFLVNHARENKLEFNEAAFADTRKMKSTKVEDLHCPICKTGEIVETDRAFGCSRWRDGCAFTIWKDCFSKKNFEYPPIDIGILRKLLSTGELKENGKGDLYFNNDYGYKSLVLTEKGVSEVKDIVCVERWSEHCPNCKQMSITESSWKYSCAKCGFTIWKQPFSKAGWNGVVSRAMLSDLLTEGQTDAMFLGTNNRDGMLVLDEDKLYWYKAGLTPGESDPSAVTTIISDYKPQKAGKKNTRSKGGGKKRTSTKKSYKKK